MKPSEALQILDNVAQSFQGNRADHIKLQEAIAILKNILPTEKTEEVQSKTDSKK